MGSSDDGSATQVPFELEVLAGANRYQHWLVDLVRPYLGKRVLEIGSGIGNMSRHLPLSEHLVFSEVDPFLAKRLAERIPARPGQRVALVSPDRLLHETFREENFDTVVSFNVLEHVLDEAGMLRDVLTMLSASQAGGPKRIVTLVPAHQWAYGRVDKAFGHYRRYSVASFRQVLSKAGAKNLEHPRFQSRFVNIPGLFGWWINGKFLGRSKIGSSNIKLFETLCPLIRPVDDFLHHSLRIPLGNSLLTIYEL